MADTCAGEPTRNPGGWREESHSQVRRLGERYCSFARTSSEGSGSWQGWKKGTGLRDIRSKVNVINSSDLPVRVESDLGNLMSPLLGSPSWCH